MVYIALAQAVSYAAQAQVLEYFAPAFSASAGPFATATGSSILSLSCPPSTLALVVEYIAPAQAVYAAPAPVMVYLALAQAVSYAAQAQVLEYFAPAFSASAGPFATATGSSILSLSCPPSTLALVVEYIAPAPAVYAAPAPVMVYLALAQAVSYAAPATLRLRLQPMPHLLRLQQVASVLSLSCPPSTFALVVEYFAPAPQWYAAPRLS